MNRGNLEILANHIATQPQEWFSMEYFEVQATCGTIRCSCGNGPEAGIEKYIYESWKDYADRVFDLSLLEWNWCFSPDWVRVDNTPDGAARRIRFMLINGVPDNFYGQINGVFPLCY